MFMPVLGGNLRNKFFPYSAALYPHPPDTGPYQKKYF